MSYSLVADVQNEFRSIDFSATNADITGTKVQSFIDQETEIIDGCLKSVYVLPVTGAKSLEILKRVEIALVSERVAAILDLKRNLQPSNIKQEFNKKDYAKWARKYLDDLKRTLILLPDADLLDSDVGLCSYTEEENIEPVFDKCKQQW